MKKRDLCGFTLVEVMVATVVFALAAGGMYAFLHHGNIQSAKAYTRQAMVNQANVVLKALQDDFRMAASASLKFDAAKGEVTLLQHRDGEKTAQITYRWEKPRLIRKVVYNNSTTLRSLSTAVDDFSVETKPHPSVDTSGADDPPEQVAIRIKLKANVPGSSQPLEHEQHAMATMREISSAKNDPHWRDVGDMKGAFSTYGNLLNSIGEDAKLLVEDIGSTLQSDLDKIKSDAKQPFIDINAAAVTGTLLESELFGHEKGAFTDAQRQKKGVFELADKGTLFLDEIGDLDTNLQAKLLRVLQEKRFRRVGGSADISVDVRIIAATNADLEKAMEEGRLRRELFYRLNVFTIFLPPLRERKDDIPLLAHAFLDQFRREFSKDISGFTSEACEVLLRYDYPGNVRELKNLIERATLLETTNKIRAVSLPEELRSWRHSTYQITPTLPASDDKPWETSNFNLKDYVDGIEKKVVQGVLEECKGKKNEAARKLGLTRFALRHQMKKHGLGES